LVSDVYDGRPRMGPALRRREICIAISAGLIAVLTFAAAVHLLLLASMRADVVSVFFRALVLSGMLSLLPLGLLWLLERREARRHGCSPPPSSGAGASPPRSPCRSTAPF
jgi:hypothetical protein